MRVSDNVCFAVAAEQSHCGFAIVLPFSAFDGFALPVLRPDAFFVVLRARAMERGVALSFVGAAFVRILGFIEYSNNGSMGGEALAISYFVDNVCFPFEPQDFLAGFAAGNSCLDSAIGGLMAVASLTLKATTF